MLGENVRAPIEARYDSTKGGKPIEFTGPRKKGSKVNVDTGKGQELSPLKMNDMNAVNQYFSQYLQGRLNIGGRSPRDFGESATAGPAAGLNILRHQSLTDMRPPQQAMERTYEWIAHEVVSQFKSMGKTKMEIQGADGTNRIFKTEVKPSDIDDTWAFKAELKIDFPQDDMANMGMAVQGTQAGIWSVQTAREVTGRVDDTDLEQEIIDRESVYAIEDVRLIEVAAAAIKDNPDSETAQILLDIVAENRMMRLLKKQQAQQQPQQGVASQPGVPSPVRPSGMTTAATPTPPAAQQTNQQPSKLRNFLSKFGIGG